MHTPAKTVAMSVVSVIKIMEFHSSGVFLGCKIRGADFCSMQKVSLTMQKFFRPIFKTSQKLWISNVVQKNEF